MKLILLMTLFVTNALWAQSKVIYGEDNRVDVLEASAQYQELASKTLAMIAKDKIDENFVLHGEILGVRKNLCKDERFYNQLAPATCSSFLVGEDILVTAGHCIKNQVDCDRFVFVKNFYQESPEQRNFKFTAEQIFYCKEILEQRKTNVLDYAVIRLDRKVPGVIPFKYRRKGKIKKKTPVIVIGQPSGMPTKVADHAYVRGNFFPWYFSTTLDTFGGNSGSVVINAETFEAEGILVRGEIDYVLDEAAGCMRVKRCKESRCRGEEAIRLTKVKYLMEH